jgi:hypothetical protein
MRGQIWKPFDNLSLAHHREVWPGSAVERLSQSLESPHWIRLGFDDARRMGGPIDATVPSVALWTGSPGRRCDAPQCEALALLINAADGGANALRRQPSRGHDQLSFDDRLADVLDRGDGFALHTYLRIHNPVVSVAPRFPDARRSFECAAMSASSSAKRPWGPADEPMPSSTSRR